MNDEKELNNANDPFEFQMMTAIDRGLKSWMDNPRPDRLPGGTTGVQPPYPRKD